MTIVSADQSDNDNRRNLVNSTWLLYQQCLLDYFIGGKGTQHDVVWNNKTEIEGARTSCRVMIHEDYKVMEPSYLNCLGGRTFGG